MRAHVNMKVNTSFRKKQTGPSPKQNRDQEKDQTADEEVEETSRFWAGVQVNMDKTRDGKDTPKVTERRRTTQRLQRRPSLQLSETLRNLKNLKPKWFAIPQPVRDQIEKIPVINPNHGLKVRTRAPK